MSGDRTLGQALVAAAVVHAALFVLAGRVRHPPSTQEVPLAVDTFDITPEPVPEAVEPSAAPPSADEPTPTLAPQAKSTKPERVSLPNATSPVLVAEPTAHEDSPWTIRVTRDATGGDAHPALAAIGLAGQNSFMGKRETSEDEARAAQEQANRAAGEAMRAALHDHDVAIGLGGGGRVVAALEAAVRESFAPDESRAVLVAIADESGLVRRVDVESASDNGAFQAVAEALLRRLNGQRLRVPAGARGLAMHVHVDSVLAAPSGGGVGLDPRSAGAHFDIADLGQKPRRVIHARVLAEEVL